MPPGTGPRVVLASGSPRRRDLLGLLGVPFTVAVSGESEDSAETNPARLAGELALLKGRSVWVQLADPGAVVIAADTVVSLGGRLLAKPADEAQNAAFVRALSGRTHDVLTGVAVLHGSQGGAAQETVEVAHTAVTFRDLSAGEVAFYAASGEGLDKAGGYGIQHLGAALVARVEGEFSNVVGFPLSVVLRLLRGAGVPAFGEGGAG